MDAIARRLLFHIGTVGFCLNLGELVEIREPVTELIDYSQADQQVSVVGTLPFHRTSIPVVNLASRLDILSVSPDIVLILNSSAGTWGLLVDHVEGFYSATEMTDCPVPLLLQADGWYCFDRIALYSGNPFLRLNLSDCYSGAER